jgi:hypothetical protein
VEKDVNTLNSKGLFVNNPVDNREAVLGQGVKTEEKQEGNRALNGRLGIGDSTSAGIS